VADLKMYEFTGIATVSVTCRVEATSERKARKMIADGDCLWQCDDVDGDVADLELASVDE
jgi:hypothetical protein